MQMEAGSALIFMDRKSHQFETGKMNAYRHDSLIFFDCSSESNGVLFEVFTTDIVNRHSHT